MNGINTPISRMIFGGDRVPSGSPNYAPQRTPTQGASTGAWSRVSGRASEDPTVDPMAIKLNNMEVNNPYDNPLYWGNQARATMNDQRIGFGGQQPTSGSPAAPTLGQGNINTGSQFNPFPLMGTQGMGGVMGGFGNRQMDPVAAMVQQLNALRMQILRNYIFGGGR